MKGTLLYSAAALLFVSLYPQAQAASFTFGFSGSGVDGSATLTYGSATDSKVTQGYVVTGISGTFSDPSQGISNASITGLVPLNISAPESTNLLAPADFSKYYATGLPAQSHGAITYDNLFYPAGSPPTATDYPFGGGFLDIYGLLFGLNNGDVVDLYSNGIPPDSTLSYGVVLANDGAAIQYVPGGVIAYTPEPASFWLLATAVLALGFWQGSLLLRRLS